MPSERSYAAQLDASMARHEARLRAAHADGGWVPLDAQALVELVQALESEDSDLAHRRDTEQRLAAYIRDRFGAMPDEHADLLAVAEHMETCHTHGAWGVHQTNGKTGHVVAWAEKCRDLHLCPHEARMNQQRVIRGYVPHVAGWLASSPLHRVFYAVFTVPNVRAGELREGRAAAIKRWGEWFNAKRAPTELERLRYALGKRVRSIPAWRPCVKGASGIAGALLHVEDPWSPERKDWNVHVNALLLVRGALDYAAIRAAWGFDVEIRGLKDKSPEGLSLQVAEVVKYSAKRPQSMCAWPPGAFAEWWRSQKGARRTRSYGCLHGLKTRGAGVETAAIQWMGSVSWAGTRYAVGLSRGLGRSVGLVTADNFSGSGPRQGHGHHNRAPP